MHSGVHRSGAGSSAAVGGGCSCPGGQKFTQSGMSTPGTQGIGMRMHFSLACSWGWPLPSEGGQIGTQSGVVGSVGSVPSWAFAVGSGCGSCPGRQIGVHPGSGADATSANARGSPPPVVGTQIGGNSGAGGGSGAGLSGSQAASAKPASASTPTNTRRPAR